MKKIQIILGIIVSLLVLQACGASRTTDATPVVHLATDMKPKTLHPHHASEGPSFQSIGQYSQTLLVYNESGELVPGAATSFTVSEDGMLYTFALRPDAKWSNGEQVMAADFVFAWQTLAQDEKAYYRDFLKHLANGAAVIAGELPIDELGVVAVDEFTLEIRLARPVAYFLDILAFPTLAPLNQVFYQSVADTYGTSAETVLANGPYVISKYEPEALLQFTKNEQYWDSEHVQVAEVQVRIVEEPATQSLLYDSGEIDMLTLTGDLNDKYANDPSVQVGHTPSIVYMYLSPVAQAGNEVLANKSFRQAISLAIDKELLTETVLKDGSKPLEGLVPENFGAYDGKSYREISGKHTTAVYNQTKAQALLQRAKDELGAIPLSFQLAYPESAVFKKVYENIKNQIETSLPGVEVTLTPLPASVYYSEVMKKETVAGHGQWGVDYADVESFFSLFETGATYNYGNFSSSVYDDAYNQAESTALALHPGERAATFVVAEDEILEEAIFIPLYQRATKWVKSDALGGLTLSPVMPSIQYRFLTKQ